MIQTNFTSPYDLLQTFPNEQVCIEHLQNLRWNGDVISPFDSTSKVYKCKDNKFRCKNTGKYFNVRTGTLFDSSKTNLQKWFVTIWLFITYEGDFSHKQLAKLIGVSDQTALHLWQRLKKCLKS